MMGYQPISKPTPPPPLTLSLFETFQTSDSQRFPLKIFAVIMCNHWLPQYIIFSADRLNRAEGEWLGRVQRVFIVGRSRWPQQYKFRSRCKYSVCLSLKKVPVNMLSSRANRQVLRACRLAISPFLRRNIQTSKQRSTFAKDLFLGRFNKVREMKI